MAELKQPEKMTKQELIEAVIDTDDIYKLKRLAFMLIETLSNQKFN